MLLMLLAACGEPGRPARSVAGDPALSAQARRLALDNEARVKERDAIFLLDEKQQRAKFRALASERRSELLTVEGLRQLVWLGDDAGVDLAIAQLSHPQPEVVEAAALALAEYAPPASAAGKEALLAAFGRAEARSRPAIAWALAVLGERRALPSILEIYQRGQLDPLTRLDGGPAFTLEPLADLLDQKQALEFARSSAPELRRLAASKLALDPRNAEVSRALLADGDLEVVRWAASGVARVGEPQRSQVLRKALAGALTSRRGIYLDGLMRGGGVEAALALLAASEGEAEEQRWLLADLVFQGIRLRADPRGGDALAKYIDGKPHAHFETQAALALAEIGDLRALPALARRLAIDPLKGYDAAQPWQARFAREDSQRVLAAHALGELSELYPKKVAEIRAATEQALLAWVKGQQVPHSSAMFALAAMESDAGFELLRRWADPKQPLPAPGAEPPMPETFAVAWNALRYLGQTRRPAGAPLIEKQLRRRPKNLDVSSAGLLAGRHAVLGMSLRALTIGAAQGSSAAGDPRSAAALLTLIDEPREHEDARSAACRALAWIAPPEKAQELNARFRDRDNSVPARWRRQCVLSGLSERVPPGVEAGLLESIVPAASEELQIGAGRALGKRGLDADARRVLVERVEDSRTMIGSALALLLGSDPDASTRTIAIVAARSSALRDELAREWKNGLVELSDRDAEDGALLRWVANARAAARVAVGTSRQTQLRDLLAERLATPFLEGKPHALSRTTLRLRLWQLATGSGDAARQIDAVEALSMMKERGTLAALAARNDALGKRARRALFEVDHPRRGPAL